jgi:hypothetical protein
MGNHALRVTLPDAWVNPIAGLEMRMKAPRMAIGTGKAARFVRNHHRSSSRNCSAPGVLRETPLRG